MNIRRIKELQASLERPILIKKKENLLYLTGRSFLAGYLLVKPKRRNTDQGRRINTDVVFLGDGLEKVEGIKFDRLKNIPLYLGKARKLDLEDEFTFREYDYIRRKLKQPPLLNPPPRGGRRVGVRHVKSLVDFQRVIKDAGEIGLVRKSMQIVERVFHLVRKEIKKPGMTEIRLAEFIRRAGLKFGAEDVSFPPIVASGPNAAVPHHVPSSKRLKAGESVIIDFGFKYRNYCSDFTRTVFLKKVPKRLEIAYNQVEKAYNESIKFINPSQPPLLQRGGVKGSPSLQKRGLGGVIAGDVYQKSVSVLAEKHLEKYFIHSLGHGTGLEIHELPNLSPGSKDILKDGMVFSIEPGVYIPKLGGIRIEDLVYLEKGKVKKFINVSTKLMENIFYE